MRKLYCTSSTISCVRLHSESGIEPESYEMHGHILLGQCRYW